MKAVSERSLALEGLMNITEKQMFSHNAIHQLLSKHQKLDKRGRAFISHLIMGTLEHLLEIDYIINQFSSIKVEKMKPAIRNILRSGVYQLKYMENIPQSAVCNEAVKLAEAKGFKNLKGFVNGNLRNIARNLENITYPTDKLSLLEVKTSIPSWILKLWLEEYDFNTVEQIAKSFGEKRPLTIRTNQSKITPDDLKENLEKEGVRVEQHPHLPYAFKIHEVDYLESLEDFKKGNFYVQDISSMLVGELINPEKDSLVLDLCAAPGGKALHTADKMRVATLSNHYVSTGQVLAFDLTDKKVALIRENIARTGFKNIIASKKDATTLDKNLIQKADIIIADVPCSGLGILGKKADLRYNTSLENIKELIKLQRKILSNACTYLKPGGILMFSTCTINPSENIENVHWLLEKFPEFKLLPIHENLSEKLKDSLNTEIRENTLQLLPNINDSDGFFIAKFTKTML